MTNKKWQFDTNAIHAGFNRCDSTGATTLPIYMSAAYQQETAEDIEDVFSGRQFGHIYSRISNPTVTEVEKRLTCLESALGTALFSSGMAAIASVCYSLCEQGSNIVVSSSLFGGTQDFLETTLSKFGVSITYVSPTNLAEISDALKDNTHLVFVETLGNPKLDIPDIKALKKITQSANIPLVVDSTLTSPYLFHGKDFGADILVHSATKYLSGASGLIAGAVVDTGLFNWQTCKSLSVQNEAKRFRDFAFISQVRWHGLHNIGATLSPFNAYLLNLGLETLSIRLDKHCANALSLATALQTHPKVSQVNYPGLPGHPCKEIANTQFNGKFGGMLTIDLGTKEKAFMFINGLKLAKNMANLGDTKTLIIHPASTIYGRRSPESALEAGVTPGLIRVSVGIENETDIINDFKQALERT